MNIVTVSATYGRKLNLGDYNSANVEMALWAQLEPGEDEAAAAVALREMARNNVMSELARLAYVVALTTSLHDIAEMAATLDAYEALRGDLRGIPFVLSRVPRMVSTPGTNGQRTRREKWLWHLEAQATWVQAQLSVMQRAALPTVVEGQYQLTAGAVDIHTGEIVDDDDDEQGEGNHTSAALEPVVVTPKANVTTNGATGATNGGYSDKFLQYCADNINRYTGNIHAVREALKKQFPAETADRKEQMARFAWLKDHAAERDAAEREGSQGGLFGEEITNGAYAEV